MKSYGSDLPNIKDLEGPLNKIKDKLVNKLIEGAELSQKSQQTTERAIIAASDTIENQLFVLRGDLKNQHSDLLAWLGLIEEENAKFRQRVTYALAGLLVISTTSVILLLQLMV